MQSGEQAARACRAILLVLVGIAACGGHGSSSNAGAGGGPGTGGGPASGGGVTTGGFLAAGGATGAGGVVAAGGITAVGGAAGSQAAGGAAASGGAAGATTRTGGVSGSGGVASGGATGGGLAVGGAGNGGAASGGATSGVGGAGGGGGATTAPTGGATGVGGAPGSGGGTAAGGATGAGGGGGAAAAGGATGAGGGSGMSGRVAGACQPGATYPAPILTGTPRLVSKDTSTNAGNGTYEGPVWLTGNGALLYSDITFTTPVNPSQILKLTPPNTLVTYLADAGTNGMAVDASGVVYACSHKVQGIVKLDYAAASFTTVVGTVGGKRFNSPNDLTIRADGTIYFTDPDFQLGNRTSETGKKGIYRMSPTGTVALVDDTFAEPNGIALSPDATVLYVDDNSSRVVRTFAVAADGSTSGRKDFATVNGPDGFGMDCLGNLYVASGSPGTVEVFAPSGTKLGSVTVAASASNVAFGGSDGKTLYITAGKALYSLDMNLPGYYD
jgi:gluconolactonase